MDSCPVCGENSVTEDLENGQTVRVCTECGAMDDDMQQLTSADQFEGTTISDGKGYGPKGGKNWMKLGKSAAETNKTVGKKLISNIGNQLSVGEHVVSEACHLYNKVYDSELHAMSTDTKKAMCLACLYASARMANISINIREFGFFMNIDKAARRFGSALKTLKLKYDVHLPPLDVENEAYRVLSQSDLDKDVVKTANQIMCIMRRAMITIGRCCSSYAVPCAYIAFKASDIVKYRKLTFTAFCKMFKFKKTLQYACRSEIDKTLKAMARELPWLKGSGVVIDHIEVYVKDIIKYQTSLFAQAVLTAVNEMEETDKCVTEVNEDSVSVFRKFPKRKHKQEAESSIDKKQKKEKSGDKSYYKQSSGNSSGLESFDLGSDDDTDLYILTLTEIKERQDMHKQFGIGLDNENIDSDTVGDVKSQYVDSKKVKAKKSCANGKVERVENNKDVDKDDDDDDDDDDDEKEDEGVDEDDDGKGETEFSHLLRRLTDNTKDEKDNYKYSDDENYD